MKPRRGPREVLCVRDSGLRPFLQHLFSERGTGLGPLGGKAQTVEAADTDVGPDGQAIQLHGGPCGASAQAGVGGAGGAGRRLGARHRGAAGRGNTSLGADTGLLSHVGPRRGQRPESSVRRVLGRHLSSSRKNAGID